MLLIQGIENRFGKRYSPALGLPRWVTSNESECLQFPNGWGDRVAVNAVFLELCVGHWQAAVVVAAVVRQLNRDAIKHAMCGQAQCAISGAFHHRDQPGIELAVNLIAFPGPTMMARIGVMRALYRHDEPPAPTPRKKHEKQRQEASQAAKAYSAMPLHSLQRTLSDDPVRLGAFPPWLRRGFWRLSVQRLHHTDPRHHDGTVA